MKSLKPGYDPEVVQAVLVQNVCSFFGRIFTDEEQERHNLLRGHRPGDEKWNQIMRGDPTIREAAESFGVTPQKIRKLLITGGYYDTETYRKIKKLKEKELTIEQIAAELHIKPITVKSYLPYERVIYNLAERSVNADRLQRFKKKWGGYKRPKAKQPESCQ